MANLDAWSRGYVILNLVKSLMLTEVKGETTNNEGLVTMKIAKEIHDEIVRFASSQNLSLREATDKIFFAKVAAANLHRTLLKLNACNVTIATSTCRI
jgi:hypothetical protein